MGGRRRDKKNEMKKQEEKGQGERTGGRREEEGKKGEKESGIFGKSPVGTFYTDNKGVSLPSCN